MKTRLVLDCDPGDDDALAILVAHHYADLIAVTTVAGNADLADTTRNALHITEALGINVPIFAGADKPLVGVAPPRPTGVHGAHGLGDAQTPSPTRQARPEDAADALATLAREHDDLCIVATGPLTNVATAITRTPDLVERVRHLVIMGGTIDIGNRSAVAEANVWADPEAAQIVFDAAIPTTLVGLHVTRRVAFDRADVAALEVQSGPTARFFAPLLRRTIEAFAHTHGGSGRPLHDPCAVLALTHPAMFTTELRDVRVELDGRWTRGMTVVDRRANAPQPAKNAKHIAMNVNTEGVRRLVLDALVPNPA